MNKKIFFLLPLFLFIVQCDSYKSEDSNLLVKYNIIEPGNGIYAITMKNIKKDKIINNSYEAVLYDKDKIIAIERYNESGLLTDQFGVAAISRFEYNSDDNLKYLKYFDSNGFTAIDQVFGYSSIEYIYDEQNRVVMEIYRDKENKFLSVPKDDSGNIEKGNFLSPILAYEYLDSTILIKAFDQNFNLMKEIIGEKPCVPFIDCGEDE